MNKLLDMRDEHFREVMKLPALHLPGIEVWAYGSRAQFKARPQSDLDLVVFAAKDQRDSVYSLREAFEESLLPFQSIFFLKCSTESSKARLISALLVRKALRANGQGLRDAGAAAIHLRRCHPKGGPQGRACSPQGVQAWTAEQAPVEA